MTKPICITRRFPIDAGHRLMNHESKCRNIHGHRYVFEVAFATASELDANGRIIDFGVVKDVVGGWLNEHLDHGMIVDRNDLELQSFLGGQSMKTYIIDAPPSIENLVALVFEKASELMKPHGISVVKVRGYETENCWADFSAPLYVAVPVKQP